MRCPGDGSQEDVHPGNRPCLKPDQPQPRPSKGSLHVGAIRQRCTAELYKSVRRCVQQFGRFGKALAKLRQNSTEVGGCGPDVHKQMVNFDQIRQMSAKFVSTPANFGRAKLDQNWPTSAPTCGLRWPRLVGFVSMFGSRSICSTTVRQLLGNCRARQDSAILGLSKDAPPRNLGPDAAERMCQEPTPQTCPQSLDEFASAPRRAGGPRRGRCRSSDRDPSRPSDAPDAAVTCCTGPRGRRSVLERG